MNPLSIIVGAFAALFVQKILDNDDEKPVVEIPPKPKAKKRRKKKVQKPLATIVPIPDNSDSQTSETDESESHDENDISDTGGGDTPEANRTDVDESA